MHDNEFNNYYKKIENQLKEELHIEKISPNDFKNYSLKYLKKLAEFQHIKLKLKDNSYKNIKKNFMVYKDKENYRCPSINRFNKRLVNRTDSTNLQFNNEKKRIPEKHLTDEDSWRIITTLKNKFDTEVSIITSDKEDIQVFLLVQIIHYANKQKIKLDFNDTDEELFKNLDNILLILANNMGVKNNEILDKIYKNIRDDEPNLFIMNLTCFFFLENFTQELYCLFKNNDITEIQIKTSIKKAEQKIKEINKDFPFLKQNLDNYEIENIELNQINLEGNLSLILENKDNSTEHETNLNFNLLDYRYL